MTDMYDSECDGRLTSYSSSATLYNASSVNLTKLPFSSPDVSDFSRCGSEAPSGRLQSLPTEVLLLALSQLDRGTLCTCLRVNSVFASIAFPLLYRTIALGNRPWPSFSNGDKLLRPFYLNRGMLVHFVRVLELSPHSLRWCRDSGGWTTSLPPLPVHTVRLNFTGPPLPYHPEGAECDSPLPCAALRHCRPQRLILRLPTIEVPRTALPAEEVVVVFGGGQADCEAEYGVRQANFRHLPRKCRRLVVITMGGLSEGILIGLIGSARAWSSAYHRVELVGFTLKRVDEGKVCFTPIRDWVAQNDWRDVLSVEEARHWL